MRSVPTLFFALSNLVSILDDLNLGETFQVLQEGSSLTLTITDPGALEEGEQLQSDLESAIELFAAENDEFDTPIRLEGPEMTPAGFIFSLYID